jgi:hypothetical protein
LPVALTVVIAEVGGSSFSTSVCDAASSAGREDLGFGFREGFNED